VDEGGLAVVDVGDDGDVSQVVAVAECHAGAARFSVGGDPGRRAVQSLSTAALGGSPAVMTCTRRERCSSPALRGPGGGASVRRGSSDQSARGVRLVVLRWLLGRRSLLGV